MLFRSYGSDFAEVEHFLDEDPARRALLHPSLPYLCGQVQWAVRHEMARTLEDVLARRTRSLLLGARAAIEAAPRAAALMAADMGHDQAWVDAQVREFTALAQRYLPPL